jgi:hypothetical protein
MLHFVPWFVVAVRPLLLIVKPLMVKNLSFILFFLVRLGCVHFYF